MTQLGGHAIFYSVADAPLGKKETLSDTAKASPPPPPPPGLPPSPPGGVPPLW